MASLRQLGSGFDDRLVLAEAELLGTWWIEIAAWLIEIVS